MTDYNPLSKREEEVVELLLQGKSNKQIALSLGISDHTVEFHLRNVYAKLQVSSRAEAIIKLGKSTARTSSKLGESAVEEDVLKADNRGDLLMQRPGTRATTAEVSVQEVAIFFRKHKILISSGILLAALLVFVFSKPKPWERYERECEYPDEATVGQMIWRSTASDSKVHGQFGTTAGSPWPAQSGYVTYKNISIPQIDQLYLKLRYSKNSPSSVPILIYMDDEPAPRASIYPVDQQNWDRFTWTEPIFLGSIEGGVHSIQFSTDGQQYGVADLDKLIITGKP